MMIIKYMGLMWNLATKKFILRKCDAIIGEQNDVKRIEKWGDFLEELGAGPEIFPENEDIK